MLRCELQISGNGFRIHFQWKVDAGFKVFLFVFVLFCSVFFFL